MAVTPSEFATFKAEVVSVKGECGAGHRAGDRLALSCWDPGGLCGFFYHAIFADLSVMQFGGQYPWMPEGELVVECQDRHNLVTLRITKE